MAAITVAALARAGGVGVETVRFYQRRGLLRTPERPAGGGSGGGVRRYGEEDVRRLRFIRSAQAAGFTLDEIGELLQLDAGQDRPRIRELAAERLAALDARIAELTRAREALQGLVHECASGGAGPCPIFLSSLCVSVRARVCVTLTHPSASHPRPSSSLPPLKAPKPSQRTAGKSTAWQLHAGLGPPAATCAGYSRVQCERAPGSLQT